MPTISKDIYSNIFNILHGEQFANTVQQLPKSDYMLFYDVVNEKMVFVKDKTERKNISLTILATKAFIEQKYNFVFLGCHGHEYIDFKSVVNFAIYKAYVNLPEYNEEYYAHFSNDAKFD